VLPSRESYPFTQVDVGLRVILVDVPDGDPELLRYLGELALYPGAEVPGAEVPGVDVAPFDGRSPFVWGRASMSWDES
jgi:hypothetical protein